MTDHNDLDRELERLLDEAEGMVAELRAKLDARRAQNVQHAEIDRLAEHLADARVRWADVRAFFTEVLHEILTPRPSQTAPGTTERTTDRD